MAGHGGGAWKVAYADFVTAMMAFFMVMWITAQSKPVKKAVASYFQDPSGHGTKPSGSLSVVPGNKHSEVLNSKNKVRVATPLKEDLDGELIKTKQRDRSRVTIRKLDDQSALGGVFDFDDGAVELNERQRARLKTVATDLAGKPHIIEVYGGTSDRPMPDGSEYTDRWELAYTRCRRIAAKLESLGIEPKRLRVVVSPNNLDSTLRASPTARPDCRVEVYLTDKFVEKASPDKPL